MTQMTFQEALVEAQIDAMEEDKNVFLFGLDVDDHKRIFGSTEKILEKFGPKRIFSTPLSEDAMTGAAIGAAISGARPIHVHIRTDFLLLGMNQLANMASCLKYLSGGKLKVPLVIRAVLGRGWGQGAQHSKTMHGMFAHIPGLKVVMPTTPQDAYSMMREAVRDDAPVLFLEQRWLYYATGEVDKSYKDDISKAKVISEGTDLTVVSTSWMNVEALAAKDILKERGINIELIDARSISPIDDKTIFKSVNKTGYCIVADYDWLNCGFSSEVAARVSKSCFDNLKSPVERIGFEFVPTPTTRCLEDKFYPNSASIVRKVEELLKLERVDLSNEQFYTYENRFKGPF